MLLEALAVGGEVEQLPPALLEALFGGMVGLQVALPEVIVEVRGVGAQAMVTVLALGEPLERRALAVSMCGSDCIPAA